MVTSEERAAIASRLRNEASNCRKTIEKYPEITGKIDLGDVNAYFQDVMHFCGIDGVTDAPTVFERLADLIDPVCYVVSTTSEDFLFGPTFYRHQLSCGHECGTGLPSPPEHCDVCGARVSEQ